jgi:hypothetical protein
MGGLGGADGQPGYHSPNNGGSVSLKRTITAAKTANRCPRLLVLLFRTRNYLEDGVKYLARAADPGSSCWFWGGQVGLQI